MSNHAHRARGFKKSPYMGKSHANALIADPDTYFAQVLDTCTCDSLVHVYDAGHGTTGVAILHDPACPRLGVLGS